MKLIIVKLKGWKDKTVKEPIKNGKMNKIKQRLSKNFLIINETRILFFYSFHC